MNLRLEIPTQEHEADISAIWEAGWHQAHAEIVPAELLRRRTTQSFLDRTKDCLANTRIVHADGAILGFCMVKEDELYQLYVAPAGRGTGAAQTLIMDAENRIRAAGYNTPWLGCAVGNARAMRFYEKSGWTNQGREVIELDTSEGTFPLEVWRFENLKTTHA